MANKIETFDELLDFIKFKLLPYPQRLHNTPSGYEFGGKNSKWETVNIAGDSVDGIYYLLKKQDDHIILRSFFWVGNYTEENGTEWDREGFKTLIKTKNANDVLDVIIKNGIQDDK